MDEVTPQVYKAYSPEDYLEGLLWPHPPLAEQNFSIHNINPKENNLKYQFKVNEAALNYIRNHIFA
jgi:hypothetical protein